MESRVRKRYRRTLVGLKWTRVGRSGDLILRLQTDPCGIEVQLASRPNAEQDALQTDPCGIEVMSMNVWPLTVSVTDGPLWD